MSACRDLARARDEGLRRRRGRGRRRLAGGRRRRVHGARRAVGLRQVDAAADDRRARAGDGGADRDRRARRHRPSRRPTATSRWSSRATRCTRTRPCARTSPSGCASGARPRDEIDAAGRRDGARCSGSSELMEPQAGAALGRPAPARRDGPGAGARAARVPAGRAALEPRREAAHERCAASSRGCTSGCATTTVYVTHDQVEAMTLGQRVAVLRDGVRPAVRRPAGALPPAREPVRGGVHRLAGDEPRRGARSTAGACASPSTRSRCRPTSPLRGARRATSSSACGRRASRSPARAPSPTGRGSRSTVDLVEELGDESQPAVHGRRPARRDRGGARRGRHRRRGRGPAAAPTTAARASRASLEGAPGGPAGRALELALDPRELHLFDPASGAALAQDPVSAGQPA